MQVFGLEPLIAAIVITILGVTVSVTLGWLKGKDPINPRQIVASALIAFIVSIQLVIVEISFLPDDIPKIAIGVIVFGLIAQVGGIDSMAKSAAAAASKALKPS